MSNGIRQHLQGLDGLPQPLVVVFQNEFQIGLLGGTPFPAADNMAILVLHLMELILELRLPIVEFQHFAQHFLDILLGLVHGLFVLGINPGLGQQVRLGGF